MAPRRGPRRGDRTRTGQFVLDCSVVFAWFFTDEKDPWADSVARSLANSQAIVPSHWSLEVANTLAAGERRNRSTEAQATAFISYLQSLPIVVDDATPAHALSQILGIARARRLSAYDAAYVELASRRGIPLATLDEDLKAAAQAIGIAEYVPAH